MLYENWQTDYVINPAIETAKQAKLLEENGGVPVSTDLNGNVLSAISDRIITVTTDVYQLQIDTKGGTLQNLDLLKIVVINLNLLFQLIIHVIY